MTAAPGVAGRRLILVACILGSGIVFLDGTVVNVALPAIQADLGGSLASQQWVVEGYLLTLGSLLLVGGSLDDLFERRTVFAVGVVAFGVTSLICAVAPSVGVLIGARMLQGVAGALLVPSTLAIIVATFPESERGAAIGTWTAWTGISTVVGPLAGGALIDGASWRFVFLLNVPVVLVTLVLTFKAIPHTESQQPGARVDFLGATLCAVGLGGVVFALIEQSRLGWSDPLVAGAAIAGVVALVAFIAWERRAPNPMLPLGLFRSRNFAVGNLATLTLYAGLGGGLFFVGLFLQQVAGYSATAAGAAFLPLTALMFVLARRWGALADRYGPRLFMGIGPIVAGVGLLLMLRIDAGADYVSQVLPALVVFALGLSITVAPLTSTVLGSVDESHAGIASGANNATARIAGLLAIAVLGAFVAARFSAAVDDRFADSSLGRVALAAVAEAKDRSLTTKPALGVPLPERATVTEGLEAASTSAFHVGIGAGALLVIAGGAIALAGIQNPRRKVAAATCAGGALVGASQDLAREPAIARSTHGAEPDGQGGRSHGSEQGHRPGRHPSASGRGRPRGGGRSHHGEP
jgi:EmrB/QacA subfamily drug resistance transporter